MICDDVSDDEPTLETNDESGVLSLVAPVPISAQFASAVTFFDNYRTQFFAYLAELQLEVTVSDATLYECSRLELPFSELVAQFSSHVGCGSTFDGGAADFGTELARVERVCRAKHPAVTPVTPSPPFPFSISAFAPNSSTSSCVADVRIRPLNFYRQGL